MSSKEEEYGPPEVKTARVERHGARITKVMPIDNSDEQKAWVCKDPNR